MSLSEKVKENESWSGYMIGEVEYKFGLSVLLTRLSCLERVLYTKDLGSARSPVL